MTTAINIEPEFSIAITPKLAYMIDSGDEDLNRTLASAPLSVSTFKGIHVKGFDEYHHFDDEKRLRNFVENPESDIDDGINDDAASSASLSKLSKSKKDIGRLSVVKGTVSIETSTGEVIEIAHPIYKVYPDKKGILPDINDVEEYVRGRWLDTCKHALFNVGKSSISKNYMAGGSSVSPTIVAGAVGVVFIVVIGIITIMSFSSNHDSVDVRPTELTPQLASVTPLMAADTAQINQAQNPSDFAKLQLEQTEQMLQQMGVDMSAAKQNVGCFTSGGANE